jgi:hypothetical protein
MNILKKAIIGLVFCSNAVMAAPATEGSIKQLLTVMEVKKMTEGIRNQFDPLVDNAAKQALQGKEPTPKQQKAITKMKAQVNGLMQSELNWGNIEPIYLRQYKETFSEEEIAAMLAFYKTPAGQAVVQKMPGLMQKTLGEMQALTMSLAPKMQKIHEQFMTDMAAAGK